MGFEITRSEPVYKDSRNVITVSNTNYKTFKSFMVSRSIDGVCGDFRIVISRPVQGTNPFKAGNIIDIVLDGVQVMRGKIYEVGIEGDVASDDIIIAGRDITGDLVDSTVPDGAKVFVAGSNLLTMANKILSVLLLKDKIHVLDRSDGGAEVSFSIDEILSSNVGETIIGFLHRYCRKHQLFLNTDSEGNLIFFKAKGVQTNNHLVNSFKNNNNNVIFYRVKYNISERFSRYICRAQEASLWANDVAGVDENPMDLFGTAFDFGVSGRQLEFKLEEGSSSSECSARAAEESNVRRARAFEYTAEVQGFKNASVWGVNQLVTISDDKADVHGEFLIKTVTYTLDSLRGRITKIVATNKDAYTAQAAIDKRSSGVSRDGIEWVNTPETGIVDPSDIGP